MFDPVNILITDSLVANRRKVSRLLQSADFRITEAIDGGECLRKVREQKTDIVLLASNLADANGLEICRDIKSDAITSQTIIVLITDYRKSIDLRAEALDVGADDCIIRPIRNREFIARIQAVAKIKRIRDTAVKRSAREAALAAFSKAVLAETDVNGLFDRCIGLLDGYYHSRLSAICEIQGDYREIRVHSKSPNRPDWVKDSGYCDCGNVRNFCELPFEAPRKLDVAMAAASTIWDCIKQDTDYDGAGIFVSIDANGIFRGGIIVYAAGGISSDFDDDDYCFIQSVSNMLSMALSRGHDNAGSVRDEQQYRSLSEALPSGIFRLDSGGNLNYANERWLALTGLSKNEYRNCDWLACIHPDDGLRISQWVATAVENQNVFRDEFRLYRRDGTIIWVYAQMAKLKGKCGDVGFIGTLTDISTRKSYEEELLIKDRAMAECSNGILITDPTQPDNPVVYCNRALERMTGYSRDDFMSRNCRFLYGEDRHQPALEQLRQALRDVRPFYGVLRNYRKDGSPFWNELTISPVHDDDGRLLNFVGIQNDITERKATEDALEAEKERLTITLQSIADGVIATDINGNIEMMNAVAEKLTGWSLQEAYRQPLPNILRIDNEIAPEVCPTPVADGVKAEKNADRSKHIVLYSRDGVERIITDRAAPIRDGRGANIGTVLTFTDITERCKIEAEVQQAQKIESLGVFAAGIAHDFNNLLMLICGSLSIVRSRVIENTELNPFMDRAEKACNQAHRLTQQLLTFSAGGSPVREILPTADLLRESVEFVVHGSKCQIEFDLADDLWNLHADPGQIGQIIQNLVINANQAMPAGGNIRISAVNTSLDRSTALPLDAGRYVLITIEDCGVGISQENIGRIFEPFFSTKEKGSGLGLSVVYSMVSNHNGFISAESAIDRGTVFSVYLPAPERDHDCQKKYQSQVRKGEGLVLVMDDDEGIRMLVQEFLSLLGYRSQTAIDGKDAISRVQEAQNSGRPYAAAILDLTVPGGMGGAEANRLIKEILPDIKTIVSSGYSHDFINVRYMDEQFDGFIAKPYDIEKLSVALHRLLT